MLCRIEIERFPRVADILCDRRRPLQVRRITSTGRFGDPFKTLAPFLTAAERQHESDRGNRHRRIGNRLMPTPPNHEYRCANHGYDHGNGQRHADNIAAVRLRENRICCDHPIGK